MFSFRLRGIGRVLPARYRGYIFLVFITLLFFHQGFYSGHNTHPDINLLPVRNKFNLDDLTTVYIFGGTSNVITKHPIPKLMDKAEDEFRNKLQKQSQTLVNAVEEYRKRYKRNPPKGFDEWWTFVQQNEIRMVDEFDGLMHDLEPFRILSGQEIRRRTLQVCSISMIIIYCPQSSCTSLGRRVAFYTSCTDTWRGAYHGQDESRLRRFRSQRPR